MKIKNVDKMLDAAEKAARLDPQNVTYARVAADSYYLSFLINGQKDDFAKAIDEAARALELPGAQDQPGPRQWANRMQRVSTYALLARCYLDLVIDEDFTRTGFEKDQLIEKGQQAVANIEELLATGDAPQVVKWRGILHLAKGQDIVATRELYSAYEQFKSVGERDALLAYRLAKIYENSTELGAAKEFYGSALGITNRRTQDLIDNTKPEALLDYAEVLLRLRDYGTALAAVNFFDRKSGANDRSHHLRVQAYAAVGPAGFEEAADFISSLQADDLDTLKLQLLLTQARVAQLQNAVVQKQLGSDAAIDPNVTLDGTDATQDPSVSQMKQDLDRYRVELIQLVNDLLVKDPCSVDENHIVVACNACMAIDQISNAKSLVDKYLLIRPDSTSIMFYKLMLDEPDPRNISPEIRRQIEEQALAEISDPVLR
jgi:tetratricopeptide (TPR) repeat protein